jgi:hypothetical protein
MKERPMSFEILGRTGKYWSCHQFDWGNYLDVAIAFGWDPEGAFFKDDEGGYGEHPSGNYFNNDRQIVTDSDARGMAAALNSAVTTINAGSPLTDEQVKVLKKFEIGTDLVLSQCVQFTEEQRAGLLKLEAEYLAAHPDEFRTIRTRNGSFDVNLRQIMDLADVATAGSFTIA